MTLGDGWQALLSRLGEHSAALPDRDAILEGWTHLAEILREPSRDELGRLPVLYDFLGSWTPIELRRRAALGQLLAALHSSSPSVLARLRVRLLSHDAIDDDGDRSQDWATMHGALVELSLYAHLHAQRLDVGFPPERSGKKNPDLVVATPLPVAVEASYLASPATIECGWRLKEVLTRSVTQTLGGRDYFVTVDCNGWSRELLPRVATACAELKDEIKRAPLPWTKELVPGLTFTVRKEGFGTFVVVQGARAYGSDPYGAESVLTRLPSKLRDEASQLRDFDGVGVVFIVTSEIQIFLHQVAGQQTPQVQEAIYAELLRTVRDVGREHPEVSVFVLYDVLGSDVVPRPYLPRPARVRQHAVEPRELHRVAFIPNANRRTRLPRHVEEWFTPPLPW